MVSAATTENTKKDLHASELSDDQLTSESASASLGPSSTTQGEETHKALETDSPAPPTTTSSFPYLKVSGLLLSNRRNSVSDCVWNQKT